SVWWWVTAVILAIASAGCWSKRPSVSLHAAVNEGNYGAVRQQIARRSDLNAKDGSGYTALHIAARKGDLPMVRLLVEAGADPAIMGPNDETPLDVARQNGHDTIVQYLQTKLEGDRTKARTEKRGRKLIDGGTGVSDVLDSM
ncbi:MAG: ankyrin repeat domain-containing protein, partial [Verrucomicrobiae bacterium]|nr:ankyrin repeat domain-containing protein [Verrucomicrobiae bacterium]